MAEIKHLVRIMNTDLDGRKPIYYALTRIKGVGYNYARAMCHYAGIEMEKKCGLLTDEEIQKLESIIKSPARYNVPSWLFNRRKDYETGEDKHLLTSELEFMKNNDIRRLKKIKAYRGVRHMFGLPARGQRTRSNFRKNKGKPMGVLRSKVAKAQAVAKEESKK
ncbi:MAG: 30S ribosomal protein S13 [Candidatus Woesearchaeota archaeon]